MTERDFAESLLAEDSFPPAGLRVWDGSDPRHRLGIYRNNVLSSLVGALADTFPVTWQLVGAEFFRAMAWQYIRISPPRTPVLAAYGSSFSRFIAQFEPARSVPYLADVAEIEWARTMAYYASDVPPLPQEFVLAIFAHGDAADLTVKCHPSVAVTNSHYAARSVWAAHSQGEGSLAGRNSASPNPRSLCVQNSMYSWCRCALTGRASSQPCCREWILRLPRHWPRTTRPNSTWWKRWPCSCSTRP